MANIPDNLKYASSHEWVRSDGGDEVTIGITAHAQELLGDIVYVELPAAGTKVTQGDVIGVIESVKAASDLYAPISGTVISGNGKLTDTPELANQDPYGDGWFLVLQPADSVELEALLTPEQYAAEIG